MTTMSDGYTFIAAEPGWRYVQLTTTIDETSAGLLYLPIIAWQIGPVQKTKYGPYVPVRAVTLEGTVSYRTAYFFKEPGGAFVRVHGARVESEAEVIKYLRRLYSDSEITRRTQEAACRGLRIDEPNDGDEDDDDT